MIEKFEMANNIVAAYSPETLGVVFYDKSKINDSYINNQTICNKIKEELFAPDNFSIPLQRPVRTLYLCTSYNCNLNCSYCLMQNSIASDNENNVLSKNTAEKVIRYFTEISVENTEREVVFYGGEPTLYPDLLKFICDKIAEYDRKSLKNLLPCRYILCTNGMLIDNDIIDFIKKRKIYPAVSIDGNKIIHDTYRKTFNGGGSFDETKQGYQKLVDAGVPSGISMTLGLHLSNSLPELVKSIALEFSPKTLALNTMVTFENKENPWVPGSEELSIILWKAFLVAREYGVYIVKNVMDNRIKPFVERKPRIWGCTGMGGRVGVLPDGNLVPCMALSHYTSHIDDSPDFNDLFPDVLLTASPLTRKQCQNCVAKSTCGGGCPANSFIKGKDNILDEPYCIASKYFLKKLIELLWDVCKDESILSINQNGFYIPTQDDRLNIYGNIKVDSQIQDYQYVPTYK